MNHPRRLMFHGVLLFLLGLAAGLIAPILPVPRMGLSTHLEGVLNGIFLIAVGTAWSHLHLSQRARSVTFALTLYAAYMNWGATLLGAILGTSRLTAIAGAGHVGAPWQGALGEALL